ncbi:MAG TPA: hypothetical protein VFO66_13535 [Gemmatimonadaceae bacterium]|nr:hypothetical protein [Gemmatimonadaceae bacterium]
MSSGVAVRALAGLLVLAASACREPMVALGGSLQGRDRAATAIDALAARVADPLRDAKYDTARARIAVGALLPSRVWGDTAAWNSSTPSTRALLVGGRYAGSRYRLDAAPTVPWPDSPADSRHGILLTRIAEDEYAWDTDVAYALGSVRARDVATMVRLLFTSAEGRTEAELRADYRSAIPRTSRVMGQLFPLDSIHTARLADSSTLASVYARITPAGIEQRLPNFAKYMRKYAETAKMHWRLADASGATFLEFRLRDGGILIRLRSRNGELIPIVGPARQLPDTLVLHGDMTLKVRIFTAGFRNYRSRFVLTNTARSTAFAVESRQEPEWVLPLVTERLLRAPLRRPFQGEGALFRMSVRDSAGAQTILLRELHLEVKESAILRFISRLSSTAYSDFAGKVEREQLLWLRDLLTGLAADVRAL